MKIGQIILKVMVTFTGVVHLIKTIWTLDCAFQEGDTLTIPLKWEFE